MRYHWIDYTTAHNTLVESWLDTDAQRLTGCDEGFETFYQYWLHDPETIPGTNFWTKIILEGPEPIGIIAFGVWDGVFVIMEFLIRPDRRGMRIGSSVLTELLTEAEAIIGQRIFKAEAVIFPSNIASQKAFEKAGFSFHSAHPNGDAWYYRYHSGISDPGNDCPKPEHC